MKLTEDTIAEASNLKSILRPVVDRLASMSDPRNDWTMDELADSLEMVNAMMRDLPTAVDALRVATDIV